MHIHFNKNGVRTTAPQDMNKIRKRILVAKMNASEQRQDDKIYIEPEKFNDNFYIFDTRWMLLKKLCIKQEFLQR